MSAITTQNQQEQILVVATAVSSSSYHNSSNAFITNSKQSEALNFSPSTASATTGSTNFYLSTFRKSLTSSQNCVSNKRPLIVPTSTLKATLMLKSIDNPANQTNCYENVKDETKVKDKENENEADICNVSFRRESLEDAPLITAKLNEIEEGSACKSIQQLNSLIASNTQSLELLPTTTNAADELNSSIITAEHDITEDVQNLSNSLIEHPNFFTATVNTDQQFGYNNSSQKNRENTNVATVPTFYVSPQRKSSSESLKGKLSKTPFSTKIAASKGRPEEDTVSKSSDTSGELIRAVPSTSAQQGSNTTAENQKKASRLSERAKKKSWYNVLYPNYKSRSQDFKKLFKTVPNDERLIVDYSCALQRDILVQGRLYVSQNYVCFHANIFRWETYLIIKWKDVTSITKEKTALVIPNAISICTAKEKYFFATFTTRDKAFLMLFRVWQNTLMNKPMPQQEIWQWVHNCYGDELGLTTDDEDYIDPTTVPSATETDLEYNSTFEEASVYSLATSTATDFGTANSNSNQSINQTGALDFSINRNSNSNSKSEKVIGGHSSGSSGGGGGTQEEFGAVKNKSRSYFFSSNKSNLNSSNTASASGSDNKTSDNISSKRFSSNLNQQQMKANAKELTLVSVKPDEGVVNDGTQIANNSGGGKTKESKAISTTAATFDSKRKPSSKHSRQRDESIVKNSEASPTDISDSSDSDENKLPFVSTAECTSTHEGRQLVHTILPINIETLFNLLFSKSKFLVDFHEMRKSSETNFGEWVVNEEGQKTRTVNVTVQLAASVGPKTSKVTECQVMRKCSKPNELYAIDITSVNAGIPYADSFSVLMHYCLVRTVDDHTMLSVHAQIKYKKSIWGVVKGFIEKNTWAGLEDFYTALLHALQSETCIPPAKGKGRRPRRGTATQIRPLEEVSHVPVKAEPVVFAHTPHVLTPHVPANKVPLPIELKNKYRWLSLFVIVLLCFLIVLNVILLLKLWRLEERIESDIYQRARLPNISSLKKLPNTHQDWLNLLRQQEIMHETELKKWHRVLQTAIELLKKVSIVCQGIIKNDIDQLDLELNIDWEHEDTLHEKTRMRQNNDEF